MIGIWMTRLCATLLIGLGAFIPTLQIAAAQSVFNTSDMTGTQNWQGGFIGAHLGGGLGTASSLSTGGTLIGLHGGINFQNDRFVGGGVVSLDKSQIKNSSLTTSFKQEWMASARARGGVTFGNLYTYGTLGFAYGPTSYSSTFSSDKSKLGWVGGAGVDTMVTPHMVLSAEYLHYDLGQSTYQDATSGSVPLYTKTDVLQVGIGYKF